MSGLIVPAAALETEERTELRARLQGLLAEAEVPGISVAFVRDGRLAETESLGLRDRGLKIPIDAETIFEAASLSKPVVAFAVLQLVDRSAISLDEPVAKYINNPDLHSDPRWKLLTVRMLLNHTSGLPNELRPGERVAFSFTPGTRFSYSGAGYSLLQEIVERVSGLSFEEVVESTVFRPLQMTSSSFTWRPDYERRKASGHDAAGRPTAVRRPGVARAASSLHTTAGDYARFVAAVVNRERLSPASWKAMVTPGPAVQADCVVCVGRPAAALSAGIHWGLGWGIETAGGSDYLFHWGENNGDFQAFVMADPATREGIVILTNSGNGLAIVPAIVRRKFPAPRQAFGWMGYDTYDSPPFVVLRRIVADGASRGIASAEAKQLGERQWNRIGYNLLGRGRVADAVAVFEHNVALHPESANVHDSLGEAYAAAGRTAEAIRSYERSLRLDPGNGNPRERIEGLKSSAKPVPRLR